MKSTTLRGGIDDDLFTVNESTGEINFQTPPNYEHPVDNGGDNIYVLEINATDGLSTATQKINIEILDVNEPPSFSSNPETSSIMNPTLIWQSQHRLM